jgi:hypothetical protein
MSISGLNGLNAKVTRDEMSHHPVTSCRKYFCAARPNAVRAFRSKNRTNGGELMELTGTKVTFWAKHVPLIIGLVR